VTALQNIGEQPTAWVLNPGNNEASDLLKDTTGSYLREQGDALWRLPRVVSAKVPSGTAILGDWRYACLVIREDAQLAADRSGTNFTNNLVQLRLEGRYGFTVTTTAGIPTTAIGCPPVVGPLSTACVSCGGPPARVGLHSRPSR
jgi:HK97 family phage major capsid protein